MAKALSTKERIANRNHIQRTADLEGSESAQMMGMMKMAPKAMLLLRNLRPPPRSEFAVCHSEDEERKEAKAKRLQEQKENAEQMLLNVRMIKKLKDIGRTISGRSLKRGESGSAMPFAKKSGKDIETKKDDNLSEDEGRDEVCTETVLEMRDSIRALSVRHSRCLWPEVLIERIVCIYLVPVAGPYISCATGWDDTPRLPSAMELSLASAWEEDCRSMQEKKLISDKGQAKAQGDEESAKGGDGGLDWLNWLSCVYG